MSAEADQARVDNFATQVSAIERRLVDPDRSVQMEEVAIGELQKLYDAYPDNVQATIRKDIMPRCMFSIETGWVKCPYPGCVRGMISPDREEFVEVLDSVGNKVRKMVAIPKETCPQCKGLGEIKA